MRTRPPDLSDADVVARVGGDWGIRVDGVTYSAVGFGSHHWEVVAGDERWFVTVDDLDARRRSLAEPRTTVLERLRAALMAAREIADHGLHFVIAPRRTHSGEVLVTINDRYVAAVYGFVNGTSHEWGDFKNVEDRLAVLDLIVQVHAVEQTQAITDDLAVPMIDELLAAAEDLARPWDSGPYAEPARRALAGSICGLQHQLDRHPQLVRAALARPERFVLTHGEPHLGNTMSTPQGLVLVDWDTALLAPPERDLWTIAGDDRSVLNAYMTATGRTTFDDTVTCYRLTWDLTEIALYVALLRAEHDDTEDVRESWRNLQHYLHPFTASQAPLRSSSATSSSTPLAGDPIADNSGP